MMRSLLVSQRLMAAGAALLAATAFAGAQAPPSRVGTRDTVVRASTRYGASGLHRELLGNNYRDLWALPIRVPFLDLRGLAGGLKPDKVGGNAQTRNLHFVAANGTEWVFRPVYKDRLKVPDALRGTVAAQIFADELSASHPAATVMAPPFLEAVGVLHPTPVLVVMPNDTLLGEFQEDFAGRLGTIEDFPTKAEDAPGWGGAESIIDSDKLLVRLNEDPDQRIDEIALLKARLVDMILGDNDRHPGQWKWARMKKGEPWEPIPRDRDKAFVSYDGLLVSLGRLVEPQLVSLRSINPTAQFYNAIEFDRRLLGTLDRATWDSTAKFVMHAVTDSVIDAAMRTMPSGYLAADPQLSRLVRARRDHLLRAADQYYRALNDVADIHGTDTADVALVNRVSDGVVDVRLLSPSGEEYFSRRFNSKETHEIRIRLHGGDDHAVVTGNVRRSIRVRVIGGNGTNTLLDSSTVGGGHHATQLYDQGTVTKWYYKPDTIHGLSYDSDTLFNRRPWEPQYGTLVPPLRDRGTKIVPAVGFLNGPGIGVTPRIGITRYTYGFRKLPYATMTQVAGAYSFGKATYKLQLLTDDRFEGSSWHVQSEEFVSQLETVEFHGFGNQVPASFDPYFDVYQTQFVAHPAIGLALGPHSDVSMGPILKYSHTDSIPGFFLAREAPFGIGKVGQAGLQADLHIDHRDNSTFARHGYTLTVQGSAYPATWDLKRPFEQISGTITTYVSAPILTRPVLALRAGGKKVFGDFPFYEAAYIGGGTTIRTLDPNQLAGDAALYGTGELRVPVGQFALWLPLNVGLIGFADAGKVYVNGESPGGWHTATGGGLWVGATDPGVSVTALLTDQRRYRLVLALGFSY